MSEQLGYFKIGDRSYALGYLSRSPWNLLYQLRILKENKEKKVKNLKSKMLCSKRFSRSNFSELSLFFRHRIIAKILAICLKMRFVLMT